jgi:hypothetical protein
VKKTVLFALPLFTASLAYAGPAISAGPAILTPSFEALADFANRELPGFCDPIKPEQISEVGPIDGEYMNGIVYSFFTRCGEQTAGYRIETTSGLAPQAYLLVRVR